MAPILLAVQLIQRQAGDLFAKELAIIDRQTRYLDRLVEDLQDVSRIARGKIELHLTALDLHEVLDRVVEMLAAQLEEKNQRVSLQVAPGLVVNGDAARLTRIFCTILAAASRHHGRNGQIAVRGFPEAEDIVVVIADDGPETQGRMGVGFSLITTLVELHGGTVSLEGATPGTQAVVRLPRAAGPPARAAAGSRPGPRVLVVDDNVDAADIMTMALRSRGYDARVAYDGETALAMSETFLPEVAVLDLTLPGMDGYALAARMKDLVGADKVHLVALTGYTPDANREAEFAHYFVKPVDVATIDGAIKELLRGDPTPPAPAARR
jgi:CheY-like chemotaxis protein